MEIAGENSIVCLVGNTIVEQKGHISKIFEALKHISVRMISYGGSRHSISLLIKSEDKKEVLQVASLKFIFGLSDVQPGS